MPRKSSRLRACRFVNLAQMASLRCYGTLAKDGRTMAYLSEIHRIMSRLTFENRVRLHTAFSS